MINEALAEEVRTGEQRKKRSDRAIVAVPETESAAPEPRENPIEAEANPKRRLLMKSASLTASGSGQHRQKRSIPDDESGMQVEDAPKTSTGEGTASLVAPISEYPTEHCCEVRTSSSYYEGSGQHHGDIGHGSGGLSLRKADGWNLKNHSHLTVARHLREKTHTSMLVVTIREGEERGICSAALREFLRIVKDQIEERSVVVIVSNRESAIPRNASVKIVLQENQLKYVDVEGMRVITNNRCIAEQIKSDKVENVVMDGSKVGKFGKVGREQKTEEHRDGRSQKWKRG